MNFVRGTPQGIFILHKTIIIFIANFVIKNTIVRNFKIFYAEG